MESNIKSINYTDWGGYLIYELPIQIALCCVARAFLEFSLLQQVFVFINKPAGILICIFEPKLAEEEEREKDTLSLSRYVIDDGNDTPTVNHSWRRERKK